MFFFTEDNQNFGPNTIQHAYLAILNDDIETAKKIFSTISSPRAEWGVSLCEIISGYLKKTPSYFQIRNFLEIDMDFLLKNEKLDYIELLLGSIDILVRVNQEAYKFVARVMFENKLYKASQQYMEKSKQLFGNG